jgi:energy-converting hydrogenase Eha subunit A
MLFGRRRSPPRVAVEPERGGIGGFLGRWTIPIIGALTPAALIVVNISVFIAKNLSEFRVTITILAFVSGLMLNSWTALNIYRVLQQRRPDHAIVRERNQEVVLVIGMAVVIIAAALTALFCYLGLASYQDLPNALTFLTGFFAAAIPIFLRAIFTRGTRRGRGQGGPPISTISGLPPTGTPSPPTSASMHHPIPRR